MKILILLSLLAISGCVVERTAYLPHRPRAQSWDQENLHNLSNFAVSDNCSAQYDAPNGKIRQCLPSR